LHETQSRCAVSGTRAESGPLSGRELLG
jgi:hypothetical protein